MPPAVLSEVQALVEEKRDQCLWYARRDWIPCTTDECRRALEAIRKYGDGNTFRRASELLSQLRIGSDD